MASTLTAQAAPRESSGDVLSSASDAEDEAPALTQVLEALWRILGARLSLAAWLEHYVGVRAVQVAGLRALNNLIDSQAIPRSPEDVGPFRSVCQEA